MPHGRELYRVLYRRSRNLIVLLHAFGKVLQAPPAGIQVAMGRGAGTGDFLTNGRIEGKERLWPRHGEGWITFLGSPSTVHGWQALLLAKTVK